MAEKSQIVVPVQIAKVRDEKIKDSEFFVVEGISEVGVFVQWLPASCKENYDEDETEYNLVFELKKDKDKHGLRVVDLQLA